MVATQAKKAQGMADRITSYTIDMHHKGKYIVNVDIDFKGNVQSSYNYKIPLGKSSIQIVSLQGVPNSLQEYVQSLFDYPLESRHQLDLLNTSLKFIVFGNSKHDSKIACLHHFEIFKEYRGRKLSPIYLKLILKGLRENFHVDYVLLQAFPVGMDVNDPSAVLKEQQRLENLYIKAGFSMITDLSLQTNDGNQIHYMYADLANSDLYQI